MILAPGRGVNLLADGWLDMETSEWQVLEIPMEAFERQGPFTAISFSGTFGGSFYLDDIRLVAAKPGGDPTTAVLADGQSAQPQSFTVAQSYPSPFNSDTVISYALPTSMYVEPAIFSLAGQEGATLEYGPLDAGTHSVRWDGRDDAGRQLASGVYLYRLQAGQQVETRRLVMLSSVCSPLPISPGGIDHDCHHSPLLDRILLPLRAPLRQPAAGRTRRDADALHKVNRQNRQAAEHGGKRRRLRGLRQ
ncbi:MAG: FlgD immunoglobulin-like domain containing protein [Pseudomonadota bacterium]